jgi:methylated-DNA-protein-cysteine methyltransferase-like protein
MEKMSGDDARAGRWEACCRRIYELVRGIPRGKVMTYGQLAGLAAGVCDSAVPAIAVGRIMAGSGRLAPDLPWWRVIGSEGRRGVLRKRQERSVQRDLLADEGVIADAEGHYDLSAYLYLPPDGKA